MDSSNSNANSRRNCGDLGKPEFSNCNALYDPHICTAYSLRGVVLNPPLNGSGNTFCDALEALSKAVCEAGYDVSLLTASDYKCERQ